MMRRHAAARLAATHNCCTLASLHLLGFLVASVVGFCRQDSQFVANDPSLSFRSVVIMRRIWWGTLCLVCLRTMHHFRLVPLTTCR